MKTKLIAAALAALLTTAGTAALAQDAPPPPPPGGGLLMHADANKDGIVTRAELLASVDARFAKVDANHDGKITADERQAMARPMRDEVDGHGRRGEPGEGPRGRIGRGPRADVNQDGVTTLDEARAPALKLFNYVDRNGDGKIDKSESDAFRDAAMAMHGPGGPGHGRHGRHHFRDGPPAGAPDAPKAQ